MHREAVAGHVQRVAREPRDHHPPADRPLRRPERAEQQEPPAPARRHPARQQQPREARRPHQPDQPRKHSVPPLPPVDRLELVEAHAAVLHAVLRSLPVEREFALPCLGGERRQRARHGAPFGDRQPAVGEPGEPADDDCQGHEGKEGKQPQPRCAARRARTCVDRAGARRGIRAPPVRLLEYPAPLVHESLRPRRRR